MSFENIHSVRDAIEETRRIIRTCAPESDAWKMPNPFGILAIVLGGLAWTALNEARNGVDARLDPSKQSGAALDRYAAGPKIGLTRYAATVSTGFVRISGSTASVIIKGTRFTDACGTVFETTASATVVNGVASVPVTSLVAGAAVNSLEGQPLAHDGDGAAVSGGIFGGYDVECDDDFRFRIFAAEATCSFFGSADGYIDILMGQPGVTRAWAYEDGTCAGIAVLMENKYPCGVPLEADLIALSAVFAEECAASIFGTPCLAAGAQRTIYPEIAWTKPPEDLCEIEAAMTEWLRATFGPMEPLPAAALAAWLSENYSDYGPQYTCGGAYPAFCGVYNCVELVGC